MFPLFLFPPLTHLSWHKPLAWAALFLLLASLCPAQSALDDPALSEYRALEAGNAPQQPGKAVTRPAPAQPAVARTSAPPTAPPAPASFAPPASVAPASTPPAPTMTAPPPATADAAARGHVLFIPWASRKLASSQDRAPLERAAVTPSARAAAATPWPEAAPLAHTPPPAAPAHPETSANAVAPSPAAASPTAGAAATATPFIERAPVCALLDLDAGLHVDPATADTMTTALWGALQKAQRVHLQEVEATRHVLARQGLTPGDPYKSPPPYSSVSGAVDADYLFVGNLDHAEGVWLLEVMLYSAATNSVVRSQAARATGPFEGLLDQMPGVVKNLLEAVPARVMAKTTPNGPSEVAPYSANVEQEMQRLRRENARLSNLLNPAASGSSPNAAYAPPSLENTGEPLPPVHGGNKEAPRTKTVLTPSRTPAGETAAKTPPSETTGPAGVQPTPMPTPAVSTATSPEATPAPTPEVRVAATTPVPTAVATRTPAGSPTPAPTAAPRTTPTPPQETPAPDPQAEAKSLYDQAMHSPKNAHEALDSIRRAVELQPANATYRDELMVRLYECKEYSDGARRAAELTHEGKTDGALSLLYGAAAQTQRSDYKGALASLDLLLQKDPGNAFALYNRALNLSYMNDPRAADAFEFYLKTAGNDPAHAQWVLDAHNKLNELHKAAPAAASPGAGHK